MGRTSRGQLFKRNGWYYFKRQENGKTLCRSCKTKDRAEAEKAAEDFSVGSGLPEKTRLAVLREFLQPDFSNPSMQAAFDLFARHPRNIGMKPDTLGHLRGHWNFLVRWLHGYHKEGSRLNCVGRHREVKKVGQLSQEIADEFVAWVKENSAPNTVNKYIATYKRVWNAVNAPANPWAKFAKLPQPPLQRRSLTPPEIKAILDTAEGDAKTLFTIGAYTGLRLSDCAAVRWDDFSKDLSVLRIKPRKTKDSSGVLVSLPVHSILKERLKELSPKKSGYVIPAYANLPSWKLNVVVRQVFKSCGLTNSVKAKGYSRKTPIVGFHSLRATFVTSLCEAGAPLAMVQAIVGHVNSEITQMYYRADTERARAYLEKLG